MYQSSLWTNAIKRICKVNMERLSTNQRAAIPIARLMYTVTCRSHIVKSHRPDWWLIENCSETSWRRTVTKSLHINSRNKFTDYIAVASCPWKRAYSGLPAEATTCSSRRHLCYYYRKKLELIRCWWTHRGSTFTWVLQWVQGKYILAELIPWTRLNCCSCF